MTNNYCLNTMRQVWLAITTHAKEKPLRLKMDEKECYAVARPRHHEIHNILKMQ
jgi:hypothetical protein